MPRCKKLCLAVFALIMLIILCTLTHLDKFVPSVTDEPPKSAIVPKQVELNSDEPSSTIPLSYSELFVELRGDGVRFGGTLSSQRERELLTQKIESISTLISDDSKIDHHREGVEHLGGVLKLIDQFINSFENGKASYTHGSFQVVGTVSSAKQKMATVQMLQGSGVSFVHNIEVIPPIEPHIQSSKPTLKIREAIQKELSQLLEVENIEFKKASDYIALKGQATIAKLATILNKHKGIVVEIGGHTDADGDDELNLRLSQNRVNSVKKELVKLGIDPKRIVAIGYGESRPLFSNTNTTNKQKNRRVEFIVIGDK